MNSERARPVRYTAAAIALALSPVAVPESASASETVKYVYDARGRLIEVERTQPAVTVKTQYTYDKADNRTKKVVTTTP